ncbi:MULTISPECIES: HdeD family acid-resistance protein [unclassified Nocardia]|uniref:HdeD family acid-resistance protein n=1 Tax=unclassified Nocardia TaxID=2637762 RepID=UPI001CE3DAFA|nr:MULTISPECIES: HdeD family acid-resistance protein [unclassified Nocardia]
MTTNSMLEGPVKALARSAWQTTLVTGLLSVVLGVIILVWPGPTLLAAGVLFGIYLVVSGFLQLVAAFGIPSSTGMRVLGFISGVLSIAIGVFCFRDELDSILLLAIWIGVGWLFRGVGVTMMGLSEPALPGRGWAVFFGLLTTIAGIVVIAWPLESVATLTVVVGVWLLVIGIMEIIMAFGIRKDARALDQV